MVVTDCNSITGRFALTLKLAWRYLLVLAGLAAIFCLTHPVFAIVPGMLAAFILYFFRNPKRTVPAGENLILSPADGVILEIGEVFEDRFFKDKTIRVSIFLSILDVHFNRSPLTGEVKYKHYRPGKFLPAFKSHASEYNEKNFLGIENSGIKVMICQITGFIARRITCWVDEGKNLAGGDLIGIIRFGSGTELFIPTETNLLVKKGDKVKAGETVIGILPGINRTMG